MGQSIFITGISGSGKSTLSKELLRRGCTAYDIEDIKGLFAMFDKETGLELKDWDNENLAQVKRGKWICNKKKLQSIINKHTDTEGSVYYCGSVSNTDELLPLFDQMIILKANPEVLRERLTNRTENDFARTAEVQKWLLQHKDKMEKTWKEKGAVFVNANGSVQNTASAVIEASKF